MFFIKIKVVNLFLNCFLNIWNFIKIILKLDFAYRHILRERWFEYFWKLILPLGMFYKEIILNDFEN